MRTDAGAVALDGSSGDEASLGGKGAALDRLIGWGLTVPRAGVVTVSTYRLLASRPAVSDLLSRLRSGQQVDGDEVDAVFAAQELPASVADQITAVAVEIAQGGLLAVRSSATVEDLAESSFAGQYRSVLDVEAADRTHLLTSVKLVCASLWHPAPVAYRAAMSAVDDEIAMAVVLMRMVPAARAGVVFTVDPAGRSSDARIEVVEGLGESLVSGRRTPDAFVTDRTRPDPALPDYVRDALTQSLAVEDRAGRPQDVEWAWDGQRVWVVQARPITVAARGDGFDSVPSDDDLATVGITEMLPGVLPPLRWEVAGHVVEEALRNVFAGLGVLPGELGVAAPLVRRVHGRAALDFGRLHTMAAALPDAAEEELEQQYFGSRRAGRATAAPVHRGGLVRRVRHDLRTVRARQRAVLDADVAIEAASLVCDHPLDARSMDFSDLLAHRSAVIDLAVRAASAELGVAAGAAAAYRRVELMLLPHLGEVEAGRWAERVTASRSVVVTPDTDASAAVFAGPTWAELDVEPPGLVGFDRTDVLTAELDRVLHACPTWGEEGVRAMVRTRALHHAIDDAIEQLHRREATKAAVLRLGGEVRRIHLALGARLIDTGDLPDAADIELLTTAELRDALPDSGAGIPAPAVLRRRAAWRERYEAMAPLPVRFRGEPPPPPMVEQRGDRLDGWAASPGRFRGVGHVLTGPTEPFEDGGVLVAEATDASWSPLFVRAGAIVLERGGPLSHASILARELGVPAVLNVAGATSRLDGELLDVDGDAGVVIVADHPAEPT